LFDQLNKWHQEILNEYAINTAKLADPFMPIETVARPPAADNQPPSRRLPMIQRLELNQFTLTAIIVSADPNQTTAMMDSGGKSYLVKKGTKIGRNNGFVREITESKVVIEEPASSASEVGTGNLTEFRLNPQGSDADEGLTLEEGGEDETV
jgi:Tfp pilus assembly protein PilP